MSRADQGGRILTLPPICRGDWRLSGKMPGTHLSQNVSLQLGCPNRGGPPEPGSRESPVCGAPISDPACVAAGLNRDPSVEQEDAKRTERKTKAVHELDQRRTDSPLGDCGPRDASVTNSPCIPPFSLFAPVPSAFFRLKCRRSGGRRSGGGERRSSKPLEEIVN